MCYLFCRCTRSISMVPAAQYAHLAAFRGRVLCRGGEHVGAELQRNKGVACSYVAVLSSVGSRGGMRLRTEAADSLHHALFANPHYTLPTPCPPHCSSQATARRAACPAAVAAQALSSCRSTPPCPSRVSQLARGTGGQVAGQHSAALLAAHPACPLSHAFRYDMYVD